MANLGTFRASSLPNLMACQAMWKKKLTHDAGDMTMAETGSLVHVGMATYHASKKRKLEERYLEALGAMRAAHKDQFTKGVISEAEQLFLSWYNNEKQSSQGEVVGSEIAVEYEWPIFYDPTQAIAYLAGKEVETQDVVTISGHIDEVRKDYNGTLHVFDEKTGWTKSEDMVSGYVPQIAAYVVGAAMKFGSNNKFTGWVRRTRDLGTKEKYSYQSIRSLTQAVRIMVELSLRFGYHFRGFESRTPGKHCDKYCPYMVYPACEEGILKPLDATPGRTSKANVPLASLAPLQPLTLRKKS